MSRYYNKYQYYFNVLFEEMVCHDSISGSPGALVCTVCTECAHSKCAQIFFGLFMSVHT